jgi:hypothetical protein
MEDRDRIEAIVTEALRGWSDSGGRGRDRLAATWSQVRRQLRALRDTATSLEEDERTALQLLRRFQVAPAMARPGQPMEYR